MKLKPEFRKGSIYVKSLNTSVNLAVATQAELEMLKGAGVTHIFEVEEIFEPKREYTPEVIEEIPAEEFFEEEKKPKNKKK